MAEKTREVQAWLRKADDDLRSAQVELAAACGTIDASLNDALDPARDLTAFAWAFRYPGSDEPPPEAEAAESLALAQATVAVVREKLGRLAGT